MNEREPASDADDFRWQAFFQRSTDPLFLLNRQRRLLFVNRAWEALAGLSAAQSRGLICRRQQPAAPGDSLEDVLAHALCPPPEVLRGAAGRSRRLLPALGSNLPRWWDVEFLPLREGERPRGILGRITPVVAEHRRSRSPLPEKLVALRERVAGRCGMEMLSSESLAVRRLAQQVRIATFLPTPVLIVGEPGSGKESVARVIHHQGRQREKAFIALDCARLPSAAVAQVLLGNSAAVHLSVAGTIYLHEPQRLPHDLQKDLAMLVATGNGPRHLLAGLCGDPDEETRSGRLLPDLWCVLSAFILHVPPLRERLADLPTIVEQFLTRAASFAEKPVTELTPAAWELLRGHSWPGNLRELYGRSCRVPVRSPSMAASTRNICRPPCGWAQRLAGTTDSEVQRHLCRSIPCSKKRNAG